ncbi:DCC-interacting protein 13-alpha-like isoform X2 [Mytilus californianus]|uniref:DCC-interacting protein 13-alpha-like isoform X2 n=1 Tax=Mytilus californianus TaxID=6549 RepID=UPI002247596A|nr:DCC-interacting protein 13-alpha-like isoform X2 [Mytilus californianus]
MPGMEKLHLEDVLEDSPQTRNLLRVFENDAFALKKYTLGLHNCCQRIMKAQNELCAATQALSQQLRDYEIQTFPLEPEDSILTTTLKQFSSYLDDVSSIQQVLSAQYSETMMYPMSRFIQADLEEVSTLCEMFQIATTEHESAIKNYMKLPKKKENDRQRMEYNEELYGMRKKFHQTGLHYYSSLNALQYKRKCSLLEPILGYMHAQRAFFQMGQDAVCKKEIEEFLNNINASVQGVQKELQQDTKKTVDLIDTLEQQSVQQYHAEPNPEMPYIPPNTQLAQKGGYLFIRSKQLIATRWDRCFFFTQGGNLMCQPKDEVAGSLSLDLNEPGVLAEPYETDDRRFVFHVSSPKLRKSVVLQAENERERDEWICTINNIVRESGYVKSKSPQQQQAVKERTPSTTSSTKESGGSSPDMANVNSSASLGSPHAPKPAPATNDMLLSDVPIQFDLQPSIDDITDVTPNLQGPPKRINPFDQTTGEVLDTLDSAIADSHYVESFVVRFLGSMEVKADRGEPLVLETMRQIMAARAIHNVFRMTESRLVVSSDNMRLIDPATNIVRTVFALADISFWAAHNENKRLFGFITRNRQTGLPNPSFACHVFECNVSAEEICSAIQTATKLAFQALMPSNDPSLAGEKKAVEKIQKVKAKEKNILLQNIQNLEDADSDEELNKLPLSPDGKYLVLTATEDDDEMLEDTNYVDTQMTQQVKDLVVTQEEEGVDDSEA